MSGIRRLDNKTINQIAAGEVVERPASIVKELVENSIDAGASAITIEIENGGTTLIRVSDNGSGMDREDAEASFQRHATSKIADAEDLNTIHTLGFRGEALASIASVTQMEMLTRPQKSVAGSQIVYHGGTMLSASEVGCPEGTTILVRNLFYNTPARLKFLKSIRSETAAISELLGKLILAMPAVSIKYISNGKTIYHSPGNDELIHAIISVYGKDTRNEVILMNENFDGGLSLSGYAGKPSLSRTNRSHQSFFVNDRYVRSPLLSQCVEDALKGWTMINHHPWCVLHIQISPEEIDVNVHPSKTEIRFRNPENVLNAVRNSFLTAMEEKPYIPNLFPAAEKQGPVAEKQDPILPKQELFWKENSSPPEPIYSELEEQPTAKAVYIRKERPEENLPSSGMNQEKDDNTIDAYDLMKWNMIGSVFSTFIMVETDTQLLIIDQHAAHERLLYEQFKEAISKQAVVSQQLLPPFVLEVTHDEFLAIDDNMDSFQSVGFEMESFGGKSYLIRGVPMFLKDVNLRELFHDLLDLSTRKSDRGKLILQDEDIIMMSCKKAIKANDRLSEQEIKSLLKDMEHKKIPLTCPHGRPILISVSRYELEKKFKRIQ